MRPAVPAVLDNVITRVAHNNDVGHGVTHAGQLTGHGGAKFRNNFGGCASLTLQRQTQFAHDIGALECDLPGNGLGHLCLKALRHVGGQAGLQCLRQRLQCRGARYIVVQCGVGVGAFVGDHLGVAIATISGNHDFRAGIMNAVRQCFRREAAENGGVNHPKPLCGQNVKNLLEDVGQVQRNAVPGAEIQAFEHPRAQGDFNQQLPVREALFENRAAAPFIFGGIPAVTFEDERLVFTAARQYVTIEKVEAGVGLPVDKPAIERCRVRVKR